MGCAGSASANGYNYTFNQVREEKHNGSTKISFISCESNSNGQKKKINSESTVLEYLNVFAMDDIDAAAGELDGIHECSYNSKMRAPVKKLIGYKSRNYFANEENYKTVSMQLNQKGFNSKRYYMTPGFRMKLKSKRPFN